MTELPEARVVRGGRALGDPPRRIPLSLRLQLAFGGFVSQGMWGTVGFGSWALAIIMWTSRRHPGDDQLRWLVGGLAIAAAVGFCILTIAGRRNIYLLRFGRETAGRLLARREIHLGDGSVWEYDFGYRDDLDREHQVTIRTQLRARQLEDDALERMVYDPSGRRPAVPLDHLPGRPAILDGQLAARSSPVVTLLLPVVGVSGLLAAWIATS